MSALPPWFGFVKWAVVVMTGLIILGIGLLVSGFAKGIKRLDAGHPPLTLNFPADMEPVSASPTAEGEVLVLFRHRTQELLWPVVIIDPDSRAVTGRIDLLALPGAEGFGIAD